MIGIFFPESNRMLHLALSLFLSPSVIPFSLAHSRSMSVCLCTIPESYEKSFPSMHERISKNCKKKGIGKLFSFFFCIINKINFLYVHFSLDAMCSVSVCLYT